MDKQNFWNQKILIWEQSRYDAKSGFYDFSSSVKQRMLLSSCLLRQMRKGFRLLELGCGSGRLWEHIKSLNFHYTGVDFSSKALEAFRERLKFKHTENFNKKSSSAEIKNKTPLFYKNKDVSLFLEDGSKPALYHADIAFSCGLLDWLSLDQIKQLNQNGKNIPLYWHSFSEKRLSLAQAIHRRYTFVSYGYKTKSYQPHYYKSKELLNIFGPKARIFRNSKLSFGAFIHNLPDHVINKIKN